MQRISKHPKTVPDRTLKELIKIIYSNKRSIKTKQKIQLKIQRINSKNLSKKKEKRRELHRYMHMADIIKYSFTYQVLS